MIAITTTMIMIIIIIYYYYLLLLFCFVFHGKDTPVFSPHWQVSST